MSEDQAESKHTPGPWHPAPWHYVEGTSSSAIYDAEYCHVGDVFLQGAKRIVQCVNAHDDIVEVIERYLSASTLAELDEANRLARAALAKAKGEA